MEWWWFKIYLLSFNVLWSGSIFMADWVYATLQMPIISSVLESSWSHKLLWWRSKDYISSYMSRLLVEFVASGKILGIDYINTMSTDCSEDSLGKWADSWIGRSSFLPRVSVLQSFNKHINLPNRCNFFQTCILVKLKHCLPEMVWWYSKI